MFNIMCYSTIVVLALLNLIAMAISFEYFFIVVTRASGLTIERFFRATIATFTPMICLFSMGYITHGIRFTGKEMLTCSIAEDICEYSRKDMKTLKLFAYPRLFIINTCKTFVNLPSHQIVKRQN